MNGIINKIKNNISNTYNIENIEKLFLKLCAMSYTKQMKDL